MGRGFTCTAVGGADRLSQPARVRRLSHPLPAGHIMRTALYGWLMCAHAEVRLISIHEVNWMSA